MAQGFHAAFGLGSCDWRIVTVDVDGVALAAIQALNIQFSQKDAQLAEHEERLAKLELMMSGDGE
jgi:hypothetical protein